MPDSSLSTGHRIVLALLGVLIASAAVLLRTAHLNESLWLDELHTAWAVADGPSSIARRSAMGNTSPLYFSIVWLSVSTFGMNELALRLPSLVAGLLLLPTAAWVTWRWTRSAAAAALAATLIAVSPLEIFYAVEARSYAMVQLAGLIHIGIFAAIVDDPRPRPRIGFIIGGWLLFYLHYTAALLLVAEWMAWCMLACRWSTRPKYNVRQLSSDAAILAVGFLPAIWHLVDIAARRDNWSMFVHKQPLTHLLTLFPIATSVGPALLFYAASIFLCRIRAWKNPSANEPAELVRRVTIVVVVMCWVSVPPSLAWLSTSLDVAALYFPRYVIVSSIAPLLLSAVLCGMCRPILVRPIAALLTAGVFFYYCGIPYDLLHDGRPHPDRAQDWRAAITAIDESRIGVDDPVFVRSGLIEANALRSPNAPDSLRRYCLLPVTGAYRLQRKPGLLFPLSTSGPDRLTAEQINSIQQHGGGWFLLAGNNSDTRRWQQGIQKRLATSGFSATIDSRREFGGMLVFHVTEAREDR